MADLSSQFPVNTGFTAVDFKVVNPSITSQTNSGKIRRVGQGTSYYTWTVKFPPMTPRDFGPVAGFIAQGYGPLYSFEILLPEISYSKTISQSVAPTTVGTIPAGAVNVAVTGCSVSSEVLRAGDFFKFNNHSKVYQAVINCNSNSSGNATLYFAGTTVSNVPSGTGLTITSVPFTAILSEGEQDYTIEYGGMASMTLEMREVW